MKTQREQCIITCEHSDLGVGRVYWVTNLCWSLNHCISQTSVQQRDSALGVLRRKEFNIGDYEFTEPLGVTGAIEPRSCFDLRFLVGPLPQQLSEQQGRPGSCSFCPGSLSPKARMGREKSADPRHCQRGRLSELACRVQLPQENSLSCLPDLLQLHPFWPNPECTWYSSCKGAWEM